MWIKWKVGLNCARKVDLCILHILHNSLQIGALKIVLIFNCKTSSPRSGRQADNHIRKLIGKQLDASRQKIYAKIMSYLIDLLIKLAFAYFQN